MLDEDLPHRSRALISGHDVRTVAYQGWALLSNGALLKATRGAGFAVTLTADQNMRYRQNLELGDLAVVVLNSNETEILADCVAEIQQGIDLAKLGAFVAVDILEGNRE